MKILIDNSPLTEPLCGIHRYAACTLPLLIEKLPNASIKLCPLNKLYQFHKYQDYFNSSFIAYFNQYDKSLSKAYSNIIEKINSINNYTKESSNTHFLLKIEREILRLFKDLIKNIFSKTKLINKLTKDIDIYHSLYYHFPKEIKKSNTIKRCITIHDIISVIHPNLLLHPNSKESRFQIQQFKELGNKEIIFTVSQCSKDDLCNFNKNIHPSNVHVTHLAASSTFEKKEKDAVEQIKARFQIPNHAHYIVSTLTSDPKKNMNRVIAAFEELLTSEKIIDLYLVLFGNLHTTDLSNINKLPSNIKNKIILPGYLNDEEISCLYSGSLCFCFPSLYEGFGIPVLEAMQCGTPVITSNVSSLPEIAGDAAILIDPLSKDAICDAFLNLYNNPELRFSLSTKGLQQAKLFSWDTCASKMAEVYKNHSKS